MGVGTVTAAAGIDISCSRTTGASVGFSVVTTPSVPTGLAILGISVAGLTVIRRERKLIVEQEHVFKKDGMVNLGNNKTALMQPERSIYESTDAKNQQSTCDAHDKGPVLYQPPTKPDLQLLWLCLFHQSP